MMLEKILCPLFRVIDYIWSAVFHDVFKFSRRGTKSESEYKWFPAAFITFK